MWDRIAQTIGYEIEDIGIRRLFYDFENNNGEGCSDENYSLLVNRRKNIRHFIDQLELRGYMDFFIEMLSDHIINEYLRVHQYLAADQKTQQDIRELYKRFIGEIRRLCTSADVGRKDIDSVFTAHYRSLQSFLDDYSGARMLAQYTDHADTFPKPSVEYSPLFQLDMLGLSIGRMQEPVMDIGCGKKAELVKLLRERGIEAHGIDKDVVPGDYVIQGDYMDFLFEPATYGTIVSHMAFSNELWYLNERGSMALSRCKRKYHEILASLKPDGCFVYTPGLPFMEKGLIGYTVHRSRIVEGNERLYTAEIRRSLYPY